MTADDMFCPIIGQRWFFLFPERDPELTTLYGKAVPPSIVAVGKTSDGQPEHSYYSYTSDYAGHGK